MFHLPDFLTLFPLWLLKLWAIIDFCRFLLCTSKRDVQLVRYWAKHLEIWILPFNDGTSCASWHKFKTNFELKTSYYTLYWFFWRKKKSFIITASAYQIYSSHVWYCILINMVKQKDHKFKYILQVVYFASINSWKALQKLKRVGEGEHGHWSVELVKVRRRGIN